MALQANPRVATVATGLDMTNHTIFNSHLRKIIESNNAYIRKGIGYTEYLQYISLNDPALYNQLISEAIKETPAHKTRTKFEFGEISSMWPSKIDSKGEINIQVIHGASVR